MNEDRVHLSKLGQRPQLLPSSMLWRTSQLRILGTLKSALVLAIFFVAACIFGDDAAMRQAKQQCQARDLAPASAAYDACVHQISEEIYVSWGRDRQFMGLD